MGGGHHPGDRPGSQVQRDKSGAGMPVEFPQVGGDGENRVKEGAQCFLVPKATLMRREQ